MEWSLKLQPGQTSPHPDGPGWPDLIRPYLNYYLCDLLITLSLITQGDFQHWTIQYNINKIQYQ